MVFYAVAHGREVGVFNTWEQCKENTHGFSGAKFKKFKSLVEAKMYISKTQADLPALSPCKTGGGVEKKRGGRNTLSKCASTRSYLNSKLEETSNQNQYERIFSKPLDFNTFNENKTEVIKVKREPIDFGADFIPLQDVENNDVVIKKEKEEQLDGNCSAFFEDNEGDAMLILALSALQDHPNSIRAKPTNATAPKKAANKPIKIGKYNFTVDESGYVNAYIAGHYENVGSWNCSAGYGVYFGPYHPLNVTGAALGKISHFVADLEGAIHAIRTALDVGVEKVCVNINCEFLLKAVTTWMYAWRQKDWRNQNGKVVSNRKEFLKLDTLLSNERIFVKWRNAKDDSDGVSAQAMMEAVKLARNGCEEYLELHPNKDVDGDDNFDFDGFLDFFF